MDSVGFHLITLSSFRGALYYYQLHHDDFEKVVYVSIGGSLSDQQIELLKKLIDGTNGTVKLALDKDESGEKISNEIIEKVFRKEAVQIVTSKSKDWNQDLKESLKSLQKIMGV